MKHAWSALSARDRWMLKLLAVVVFLALYQGFLYEPLHQTVEQKKLKLIEQKQTLAWMKKVQPWLAKNHLQVFAATRTFLMSDFERQLNGMPMKQYRHQIQQIDSTDLQLSFDAVPYQMFLTWLSNIAMREGFEVKSLQVKKGDAPGMVNLVLTLHSLA